MENIWQFIAVGGTAASIAGVILAWQIRDTKKVLARMDARHLAQQATAQGILARMDRAAEHRAEVLKALRERG